MKKGAKAPFFMMSGLAQERTGSAAFFAAGFAAAFFAAGFAAAFFAAGFAAAFFAAGFAAAFFAAGFAAAFFATGASAFMRDFTLDSARVVAVGRRGIRPRSSIGVSAASANNLS